MVTGVSLWSCSIAYSVMVLGHLYTLVCVVVRVFQRNRINSHDYRGQEVPWSAVCKLETQECWWCSFSLSQNWEYWWCESHYEDRKRSVCQLSSQAETQNSFFCCLSVLFRLPADWMKATHIHWGPSALRSLPVQMQISFRNNLTALTCVA